jgi:hypothetical protein
MNSFAACLYLFPSIHKEHGSGGSNGIPPFAQKMAAGVLSGFATEDEWFDFQLENDPRFLKKIQESRASIQAGQGIPWERVKQEDDGRTKPSSRRRKRRG